MQGSFEDLHILKRALHILNKALHILGRALHILNTALQIHQRALHILKRALHTNTQVWVDRDSNSSVIIELMDQDLEIADCDIGQRMFRDCAQVFFFKKKIVTELTNFLRLKLVNVCSAVGAGFENA